MKTKALEIIDLMTKNQEFIDDLTIELFGRTINKNNKHLFKERAKRWRMQSILRESLKNTINKL